MKVLFLKGTSRNDVLRVFADRLAHEFSQKEGASSDLMEMSDFTHYRLDQLFDVFSQYDAIVSFNAIHADESVQLDGKTHYLFNMLPIKHICWMVDDVVYHLKRLRAHNLNRITLFTSDFHTQTAQSLGFDGVFQQKLSAGYVRQETKPHALRRYDVAIAASWMGHDTPFWLGYDPHLKAIIEETVLCLEQAVICNAYPLFTSKLKAMNLTLTTTALQYVLSEIHSYIRKKDRLIMIQKIVDTGMKVALIGTGWKVLFSTKANVSYVEDTNYAMISALYEEARVVVNLNAENGACERVFDGIESGAMIFSDFSNALYRMFSSDQGVLFYQKHQADESIKALTMTLAQQQTQVLAKKAQEIVAQGHTWKHRAEMLYELINSH